MADTSVFQPTHYVNLSFTLAGGAQYGGKFWIFPDASWDIILGLPELLILPVTMHFNGTRIFHGSDTFTPVSHQPSMTPGEGLHFAGGSDFEQQAVTQLLLQYRSNVFEWSGRYGLFKDFPMALPMVDETPVARRPFCLAPDHQAVALQIVDEYLEKGLIEECQSPWNSAAFLVPKKAVSDETNSLKLWRMVEDYRPVNDKLVDFIQPMPIVQYLLDSLGSQNSYYCTLDLKLGYHHIPIRPEDRDKTAFSIGGRQFRYKVMPFGLKTAPRIFQ